MPLSSSHNHGPPSTHAAPVQLPAVQLPDMLLPSQLESRDGDDPMRAQDWGNPCHFIRVDFRKAYIELRNQCVPHREISKVFGILLGIEQGPDERGLRVSELTGRGLGRPSVGENWLCLFNRMHGVPGIGYREGDEVRLGYDEQVDDDNDDSIPPTEIGDIRWPRDSNTAAIAAHVNGDTNHGNTENGDDARSGAESRLFDAIVSRYLYILGKEVLGLHSNLPRSGWMRNVPIDSAVQLRALSRAVILALDAGFLISPYFPLLSGKWASLITLSRGTRLRITMVSDTGVNGTGVNGTGVNSTGVNGTEVNGTGMNNIVVANGTNFGLNGTRLNGTGVNGTRLNGTGLNRTEVDDVP
ncbi:hypothetical protein F5Y17DRAFT_477906 [Xylariaceae sp. FL0594]|nr:hypothetical protein F5Y17DRAFT_477906 [Xylariaceae sp. FL0594]